MLGYYAIALGTGPLWMPRLARLRHPGTALILAVPVLWLCWQAAIALSGPDQLDSVLEWARLMATAHYSVFKLAMMTALGIAAGDWLMRQADPARATRMLVTVGVAGGVTSLLILLEMFGADAFARRDAPAFDTLPALLFYASLSVLLVGGFLGAASRWNDRGRISRAGLQLLVVLGSLALPIYVFHGLVIPVAEILKIAGLPGSVALGGPLAVFVAAVAYGGRRLHRMYF